MHKEAYRLKEEFISFIKSFGVMGVAVGMVMGTAVANVIKTTVDGLVMPLVELILPHGQKWQEAVLILGRVNIRIGPIIAALINFFAISLVIFFAVKYVLKLEVPGKLKLSDEDKDREKEEPKLC